MEKNIDKIIKNIIKECLDDNLADLLSQKIINKTYKLIEEKLDSEINKIILPNLDSKLDVSNNIYDTLVLSGGGAKGIALIGALEYLNELKILQNIKTIAGTSIGGLIGTLINIGYTPDELYQFILLFDLDKIKSINVNNIFSTMGIDDGHRLEFILGKMFDAKNIDKNITFKELYEKTKVKIILTGSCLNTKKIEYFSYETYPDLKVIKGLRITTSIPIYFSPIQLENKMFVDGACIDNYPINIFNNNLEKVIGIYLKSTKDSLDTINSIEDYLKSIIDTFDEGISIKSINNYEKYTILIDVDKVGMIDTNFDKKFKETLYNAGYNNAKLFFL